MLPDMSERRIDAEIDRLYQLPLEEFTAARNALAKTSGADGTWVRGLVKPPVAAWAVNQLAWRHRDLYDALVRGAAEVRRAHAAVLAGRKGDVRGAGQEHEAQIEAALKATLAILEADGHPATDATRQAVVTTLRALPGEEPPGRLTRTLHPGGFEMLAGLTIGGQAGTIKAPVRHMPAPAPPAREAAPAPKKSPPPDPRAVARAREAIAAAMRLLREAEHTARREEFERARAERDAEKSEKTLSAAREALAAAQRELDEAEEAAAAAVRARDAAGLRADKAEQALAAARTRVESAERELATLTGSKD
jgi:hypothetical protein